jgi:hypothetical protein
MNAVDPRFVASGLIPPHPDPNFRTLNPYLFSVFDAAFAAGCNYMDMGMSLSTAHPTDPFNLPGVKLGDAQVHANTRVHAPQRSRASSISISHILCQFAQHSKWQERGLLALVGVGGRALFPRKFAIFTT